jgi:DNA-binding XRE family transcriptional regulator/GNAT superfamily N-acetyltransferase
MQNLLETLKHTIVHTHLEKKPLSKEAIKALDKRRESGPLPWSKYEKGQLIDWRKALDKIELRPAEASHANTIASWAMTPDEVVFLGEEGTHLPETTVHDWMTASLASFILAYTQKRVPVAFANIIELETNKNNFEVGRLFVDPVWRRMSLGSTLFQHLCSSLSNVCKDVRIAGTPRKAIFARVVSRNAIGIQLIERLPFREEIPADNLPDNTTCTWYRYLDGSEPYRVGKEIKARRAETGVSQEYLAFQVSLSRTTINMIEAGHRLPSFESLSKICAVLGRKSQDQRISLLLATIGEERESPHAYPPISKQHDTSTCDLWVLTDKLAELEQELSGIFRSSIRALETGFDRYYILPSGAWDKQGKTLLAKFRAEGVNDSMLHRQCRFYETKNDVLCVLRVAIENPNSLGRTRISIGGEGYTRVPLDDDQASHFRDFIKSAIDNLEASHEHEAWGYKLCFPPRTT